MSPYPDPSEITFFANLFSSIAEEMGVALKRTAYSPNIKERRDFSCALFDGEGNMIAQAAHIPVHLGAMPLSVSYALRAFHPLAEGDMVMVNDPFHGGTHLPDITLVSPVVAGPEDRGGRGKGRGKPLAYLATRAHHADVGGMSPGSMPVAREIYQEGIRIPPVRLCAEGREDSAILGLLMANVRTPEERAGDLRAQVAAHQTGAVRLCEAASKYTPSVLTRQMSQLLAYGERLMRSVILRIPDGTYSYTDHLDDDGISSQPLTIQVTVTIKDDKARVDLSGSDPECRGNLNAVEAVTRSAVYYCFLCLLVTPWPDDRCPSPDASISFSFAPPLNAGCFKPVTVIAPERTIVNARPPRAVAGGNVETSQRIVDTVFGALAQALPDLIPAASQGTMNNLAIGGYDQGRGKRYAYYETIAGGMGARPGLPGLDAVHVHMTNTMNTPVEAMEFAYPLRVESCGIAPGTGGQGKWRGGHGVKRRLRLLCDAQVSLLTERRRFEAYGLRGGKAGRKGENTLVRGKRRIPLPGKVQLELKAGDVILIRTPGGGGYGRKLRPRRKALGSSRPKG